MKVTALINTGVCEIVVTKTTSSHVPEVGDYFSGRFQDENGNIQDASGTVVEVLEVAEAWQ